MNPNLLDNWYFVNPINSNGFTSGPGYNSTAPITVDRWARVGYSAATISLESDGLLFDNSSVTSGSTRVR